MLVRHDRGCLRPTALACSRSTSSKLTDVELFPDVLTSVAALHEGPREPDTGHFIDKLNDPLPHRHDDRRQRKNDAQHQNVIQRRSTTASSPAAGSQNSVSESWSLHTSPERIRTSFLNWIQLAFAHLQQFSTCYRPSTAVAIGPIQHGSTTRTEVG